MPPLLPTPRSPLVAAVVLSLSLVTREASSYSGYSHLGTTFHDGGAGGVRHKHAHPGGYRALAMSTTAAAVLDGRDDPWIGAGIIGTRLHAAASLTSTYQRLRSRPHHHNPVLGAASCGGGDLRRTAAMTRGAVPSGGVALRSTVAAADGAASEGGGGVGDQGQGEGGGPETRPFNPGPTITFGSSGLKLNLFGCFYGFVAVSLGVFWYLGLRTCDLLYWMFRNFDPDRRIPIFVGHAWGMTLLHLTGCYPVLRGKDNLKVLNVKDEDTGKTSQRASMFVANHCSWMDIPFLAAAIGWQNYKMVAKKELTKVPVLGTSLKTAKHIVLDRSNRRSQMRTYKDGVMWLKKKVHLCTFAEGTRSRDGRLKPFKKGAFKMAEAVGAPVVPVSIKYAQLVNPIEYVWPCRRARSIPAEVVIGKPVETEGKDDDEVMAEVRETMIQNLPPCQRPLDSESET